MREIPVGSIDSIANRAYFDVRLSDGLTPALDEAGNQPFVSINGGAFTDVGISVLTAIGYGRYYAQLDSGIITTAGDIIQTVYIGVITTQTSGDTFQVVDPTTSEVPGDSPNVEYYGTVLEADVFFSQRLNASAWEASVPGDKLKALIHATQIIDRLNYGGSQANTGQVLQFPRKNLFIDVRQNLPPLPGQAIVIPGFQDVGHSSLGEVYLSSDANVPNEIKQATYLTGLALLDGWDPDLEASNVRVGSDKYGPTQTTYSYLATPAYMLAGLPNITVWNLVRAFLRDPQEMTLARES